MTREQAEELILESNPEALFLDGFDDAIIGISERINFGPVVNYDKGKIIEILAKDMEPDEESIDEHGGDVESAKQFMAMEYFDFNVAGSYMGEHTPLITTTDSEIFEDEIISDRETIELDEEEFDDQTGSGPWEYRGEVYHKVTDMPNNHCDGQGTDVIVKRLSDGKHFKFTWILTRSENYDMGDEMVEVFPKKITTIKYE